MSNQEIVSKDGKICSQTWIQKEFNELRLGFYWTPDDPNEESIIDVGIECVLKEGETGENVLSRYEDWEMITMNVFGYRQEMIDHINEKIKQL